MHRNGERLYDTERVARARWGGGRGRREAFPAVRRPAFRNTVSSLAAYGRGDAEAASPAGVGPGGGLSAANQAIRNRSQLETDFLRFFAAQASPSCNSESINSVRSASSSAVHTPPAPSVAAVHRYLPHHHERRRKTTSGAHVPPARWKGRAAAARPRAAFSAAGWVARAKVDGRRWRRQGRLVGDMGGRREQVSAAPASTSEQSLSAAVLSASTTECS